MVLASNGSNIGFGGDEWINTFPDDDIESDRIEEDDFINTFPKEDLLDSFPDDDEFDKPEVNDVLPSFPSSRGSHHNFPILKRPQFEANVEDKEEYLIEVIHSQIARSGLCDIETLTDLINEQTEYHCGKVFKNSSQCVEFLRPRSFLFEKRATDIFFRNTGFAHREGIVNIVGFVQENSVSIHGCRLRELVRFTQKKCRFPVYDEKKWREQYWNDTYFFFDYPSKDDIRKLLEQYQNYFSITEREETFVGLTPLAFEIPSLWNEDLLPTRPETYYYDKSRVDTYIVDIISNNDRLCKGAVLGGTFVGRSVHIRPENLQVVNVDLKTYLPSGSVVFATAHMTLKYKNDMQAFRAERICPTARDRETAKQLARTGIDLDKYEGHNPYNDPTTIERYEDTLAERSAIREMIASEEAQIKFIDEILRDGPKSDAEFRKKAEMNTELFASSNDAMEFILDRPYLYQLQNEGANVLSLYERKTYSAMFEFLNDVGKGGISLEKMTQLLKSGVAGELLETLVMEKKLENLLSSITPFVGKIRYINPTRTLYTLKMFYDKKSKLLLPFYGSNATHCPAH